MPAEGRRAFIGGMKRRHGPHMSLSATDRVHSLAPTVTAVALKWRARGCGSLQLRGELPQHGCGLEPAAHTRNQTVLTQQPALNPFSRRGRCVPLLRGRSRLAQPHTVQRFLACCRAVRAELAARWGPFLSPCASAIEVLKL